MVATPRKPVSVPFQNNYFASWGSDHIKQFHGGRKTALLLNKQYGKGFESNGTYLFGHFSMQRKMVPDDSTGTVTTFYFLVDEVPIRVFKNNKDLGMRYPFNQPKKIYSSLWNADDWATRGGLEKNDWAKASFIASYREFHIDVCEASTSQSVCATQGRRWWDQEEFRNLDVGGNGST
eukprot:PITA_16922